MSESTAYLETTAFEWTKRAFDLLNRDELTAVPRQADGVTTVVVAGPCPRCAHPLVDRQVGVVVTGVAGGTRRGTLAGDAPPEAIVIDVTCGCGTVHDGAPEMVSGCGVSFRIELVTTDEAAS